jgi:hypothetical protein
MGGVMDGLFCLAFGTLYHKIRQREFETGLVCDQSEGFFKPGQQAGRDFSGLAALEHAPF